ncbi:MAG: hypothetical protein ABJZ55_20385 [Fuerstiella sp.]
MRKKTPEITVVTDAAYPENTLLMVQADGTYTAGTAEAGDAAKIAGVQIHATFAAGETTMRMLNAEGTMNFIAAEAVVDLTVPLRAAAGGEVAPSGAGAIVAMPLRAAVAGEYVEGRAYRG